MSKIELNNKTVDTFFRSFIMLSDDMTQKHISKETLQFKTKKP